MYGDNYAFVDNIQCMIGQFNSMSCMKQLVVADELETFGENGNTKGNALLKGLIGNTKCKWESKGMNAVTIPNFASYVFLSNISSPVNVEENDRHYTICELNEEYLEDRCYFQELTKFLNIESAGHFYKYLLSLDLSDFDFRTPYMTDAKKGMMQKNKSNNKVEMFIDYHKEKEMLHELCDTREFLKEYIVWSGDNHMTVNKMSSILSKQFQIEQQTYKKKMNDKWISSRRYVF